MSPPARPAASTSSRPNSSGSTRPTGATPSRPSSSGSTAPAARPPSAASSAARPPSAASSAARPAPAAAAQSNSRPSSSGSAKSGGSGGSGTTNSSHGPARRLEREWMLIGFRSMSKPEADATNDVFTLVNSNHFLFNHYLGFGGKSLSAELGSWDVGTGNWYAFVLADPKIVHAIEKIWVPSDLHDAGETAIQNFIKKVIFKGQPGDGGRVLRYGTISPSKGNSFDESFIPQALVGDKNGPKAGFPIFAEAFKTKAECLAGLKAMRIKETKVDYRGASWGIKGDVPPKTSR